MPNLDHLINRGIKAYKNGGTTVGKWRRDAFKADMANIKTAPLTTSHYGSFPSNFTIHLGEVAESDISAQFWLVDEDGQAFLTYTGYHNRKDHVLTLHSTTDPASAPLALAESFGFQGGNLTVPAPPGCGETSFKQRIDISRKGYGFKANAPQPGGQVTTEEYRWEDVPKTSGLEWQLVRTRDKGVLARLLNEKQTKTALVKDGSTLRGTVAFEGSGLTDVLSPYARLVAVMVALYEMQQSIAPNLALASQLCGPGSKLAKKRSGWS